MAEELAEIADGAETAAGADLLNTGVAFQQHIGSGANPMLVQIFDGRFPETSLEAPGAFSLADGS